MLSELRDGTGREPIKAAAPDARQEVAAPEARNEVASWGQLGEQPEYLYTCFQVCVCAGGVHCSMHCSMYRLCCLLCLQEAMKLLCIDTDPSLCTHTYLKTGIQVFRYSGCSPGLSGLPPVAPARSKARL